jgi:putative hemolysin
MSLVATEISENNLLLTNGIFSFKSKFKIFLEISSYILKTADTVEELIESCRLRHNVFYRELQEIEKEGIDVDQFDSHFDHLVIIDKKTNKIIGTYRLSCTDLTRISYTETEFDLTDIYALKGPDLELGRACIHKDHRRGATVLSLLWRGIIEYMNISGANVLYGCSSIKINNTRDAVLVYKYLTEQGAVLENALAAPTEDFRMSNFAETLLSLSKPLDEKQRLEAEALIPSLLKSYLKLGAKVAGEPALDKDFDCVDMLTVMVKDNIIETFARRFQVVQ